MTRETELQLILFSGLPGTGKSTLAVAVARVLGMTLLEKDRLEAAVVGAGLAHVQPGMASLGPAGNDLFFALLERQLQLGASVVADCSAQSQRSRDTTAALCARYGARRVAVHCICSDRLLHRSRIEQREREIPGWFELTWEDVERSRTHFEAWREPVLVLDAVVRPEVNLARALTYIRRPYYALLLEVARGAKLRDHRDIDGAKRFALYTEADEGAPVDAEAVHTLVDAELISSNKKFPSATYWLTDAGRAWLAEAPSPDA
jgi:predicted kinase